MTDEPKDVKRYAERCAEMVVRLRTHVNKAYTLHSLLADEAADMLEALQKQLKIAEDGWDLAHGVADLAMKHRDEAEGKLEEVRAELDEASPFMPCARCGLPTRLYKLVAEEGDEWECFPCNDRENIREQEMAVLRTKQVNV
jgi:hypothetical protein